MTVLCNSYPEVANRSNVLLGFIPNHSMLDAALCLGASWITESALGRDFITVMCIV